MQELIFQSEDDAFAAIQQYLDGTLPPDAEIKFEGWPVLVVRLQGSQFKQSITPSVMHGFMELQRFIYRSFAAARYNDPGRRLTKEEKSKLEIVVKVDSGSSLYEVDLQSLLVELIKQVGPRMNPTELIIAGVLIATMFAGKSAYGMYLESRRKQREDEIKSEHDREMLASLRFTSEHETRRMEMMANLIERDHRFDNISRLAHDAHTELVKSFSNVENAEIDGLSLSGHVADVLTTNARMKSSEIRLDGTYKILRVDSSDPLKFMVKVRAMDSSMTIDAEFQDSGLTFGGREVLQEAEWNRLAVDLKINAKELRGKVTNAVIVGVSKSASL